MDKYRVLKVFEDTPKKLQLSVQEVQDLYLLRNIIGEKNFNLQADGKLLISHYVGFVQLNNTRLLIYPKVSRNADSEEIFNLSFNIFVKILSLTGFDQVKKVQSPQSMGIFDGDILELMISLFVDEILLLFKRDVNRGYQINSKNESFIKGKIDFAENIKLNSYRKHLHVLKYEQFTENILLNKIFKAVMINLISLTTLKQNKIKLGQALMWLENVEEISLTNDIWDKIIFTRLNQQYRTAFNMAKLFYQNSSLNLNKGDELSLSFLVPLNQLFERYVLYLLEKACGNETNVRYQGPLRYLGLSNSKSVLQLKPDISIEHKGMICAIFDAKYKEAIDQYDNCCVSQNDIYQMLAYSIRYECNNIVLVYPKMLESKSNLFELMNLEIPKELGNLRLRAVQIDLEKDIYTLSEQLLEYLF